MASNTGKTPSTPSSKAPPPQQTPPANKPAAAKAPAKKPAAAKTKPAVLVTFLQCRHCRLEYQVEDQEPNDQYHAMDSILSFKDLQVTFENGEIEVSQHKAGHWCKMTFLKEHISWDYLKMPSGQPGFHQFLHLGVHIRSTDSTPSVTFTSTAADAQENSRGVEQARGFPLAKLPKNVSKLRLLLNREGPWVNKEGGRADENEQVRRSQIKRILTGVSSVKPASPAAPKLDSDCQDRKQEAKIGKKLPSGLESSKIKPTYDSDKIDESNAGPFPTPAAAAAPMLEAGLAPGEPPACINPLNSTRRDDIAEGAMAQLKAWARQQGLARKDESPVAPIGLPTEQPRPKASEVEGKGSGKDSVEEERAELELQLVQLEQTRKERQRQLWDRFKIDEYNVETSKVDQEYYQQKTNLQQQFLERRRRRV